DPTTGRMWNWQDAKIAVEYLFSAGRVTIAGRRNFERLYDLTERVLPAETLAAPAVEPAEAQRELIRMAARAQGIASARELCGVSGNSGYYPLPRELAARRVAELVEAGDLIPVRLSESKQQHYLSREAREPSAVAAGALLSPFDSLIWNRDRALRLFDFHYRISIYTPAAQRVHGYYVLPFLLGDRLVARVDLKADRKQARLVVPVVHVEPGADRDEVATALAAELRLMAGWLELDDVTVGGRGDLASSLTQALARC
ncbi:MAG TPA: crosslink repair DNA glycosylase YcaQ family protein, partial [Nocardioidaceae bacterium]|nr:crosslink repair DNA glycosylase YcaQ family protein [Nocardioidaceae bacterium]